MRSEARCGGGNATLPSRHFLGFYAGMHIGLFMMPLQRPERDYADKLAEDAEAILHADRVAFEAAWVGEHYTAKTEPITSPLIFMATLIERTRRIKSRLK